MISVIIPTYNRTIALEQISLHSLLNQNAQGFEIIVSDTSTNAETECLVRDLQPSFHERGASLRYLKASRRGTVSQRNEAISVSAGDVLFFIDDDCEVSYDAISVIESYFDSFSWLKGLGLPLVSITPPHHGESLLVKLGRFVFGDGPSDKRKVTAATRNIFPFADVPGDAEWLSGGSLAVRRDVFKEISFDEKLETFSPYASCEDHDFTHRLFLHYGQPLIVANGGQVIHHKYGGRRFEEDWRRPACFFYNTWRARENFLRYKKYPLLPFLWSMRIGLPFFLLRQGFNFSVIMRGYLEYKKAARETAKEQKS